MRLNENEVVKPFIFSNVERPWGHYGLYSDNEPCTTKILYVIPKQSLSMQYHFKRDQFYLLLDDDFIVEYSNKPVPKEIVDEPNEDKRFQQLDEFLINNLITERGKQGDMFGFNRFVIHRVHYLGDKKFGRILDVAFGENDEEDIVRIKDRYGRSYEYTRKDR